jgi:hypothetical protein
VPYTLEFYPTYRLGKVSIEYYDTHPTNPLAPGKEYSFRTVIVSDPYVKNAIINKKIGTDYNSVMKAIKDHKDNQVVIR